MTLILLGLGLVLVIEGLAIALAPSRLEDLVRVIASIPQARRRQIGLAMLAAGVALVWLARRAGTF